MLNFKRNNYLKFLYFYEGREITRSYLEKIDVEKLAEEMANVSSVEAAELFMLKHGENVVDRVGAEIDRIERNLRVN